MATAIQIAAVALEVFRKASVHPNFVDWHDCGLIDASNLVTHKQDRQHSGLMDSFGEAYLELQHVIKSAADSLYRIATG